MHKTQHFKDSKSNIDKKDNVADNIISKRKFISNNNPEDIVEIFNDESSYSDYYDALMDVIYGKLTDEEVDIFEIYLEANPDCNIDDVHKFLEKYSVDFKGTVAWVKENFGRKANYKCMVNGKIVNAKKTIL